jgi:hypothetical protein
MRPNWPALLFIVIASILLIIAWSRYEPPELQQRLTTILAALIAMLIATIILITQ